MAKQQRHTNLIALGVLFLLFLSTSCNTKTDSVFQGLNKSDNAYWITDSRDLPESDSLFYANHPAPLFRKEFTPSGTVKTARLYITAAGYYKATINGERIGKDVLDPAWTDFSKRIYYAEHDLTNKLKRGENIVGVELGNGFFNSLPLRLFGRINLRKVLPTGKPAFLAKLILEYENGSTDIVRSDDSWKYSYGPIQLNSVYMGVRYDARQEKADWNKPDYDDSEWQRAIFTNGPGGKPEKAFFPGVQITEEIQAKQIYEPEPGIYIADMGVNFTGTYNLRMTGDEGDSIVLRFGERIYDDGSLNPMTSVTGQIKKKGRGGPGAPDIAWQTDAFVFGNEREVVFSPEFTYHTFRYMEIKGLKYKPEPEDITGLFFHSNLEKAGEFSCSSDLLNQIQDITLRTFRANLVSVQSDCPAREKFGYGGDLNATAESFIYNFDMYKFYKKTLYDWVDAMNDSSFVDTAPYIGLKYCGISWESAFIITQYELWQYYKDEELIKEFYERNKEWMKKANRLHPEGIVKTGLSDHESLMPVPVELIGTCHYLECAGIMAEFAAIMKDKESEQQYKILKEDLRNKLRKKFWEQKVEGPINEQTLYASLLYHEIIPEADTDKAVKELLKSLKLDRKGHFITGIFGTKYILEALSKHGYTQEVFDIVNSREYPGWGYMVDRGATTVWETWKESDNVYSNCHPMFGSVTEWYYRWLGGIQPLPGYPGFEKIKLVPFVPEGLDEVSCSYNSPKGKIVSNWKRKEEGVVEYTFIIPAGSEAIVGLSDKGTRKILVNTDGGGEFSKLDTKDGFFHLKEGKYVLISTNKVI